MTTSTSGTHPPRSGLDGNGVPGHPTIDDSPVEIVEEGVDVRGAVRLVVEEVRVLVDVEGDERSRVPDREGVLRVAEVVEDATLVPVVGRPRPAAARQPGRLQ